MEGWRQWRLGRRENRVQRKNKKTNLTPTGLLMEGDFTFSGIIQLCAITTQSPFRLKQSLGSATKHKLFTYCPLHEGKSAIVLTRFGVDVFAGRFEVVVQTVSEMRGH